jgi:hypothetical protein
LAADFEGHLAFQHPGDLVAVVVQMERALGAGRQRLLEQHDAVGCVLAQKFQVGEAAGRRHVEVLSAARGDDKASAGGHVDILPCGGARIDARQQKAHPVGTGWAGLRRDRLKSSGPA